MMHPLVEAVANQVNVTPVKVELNNFSLAKNLGEQKQCFKNAAIHCINHTNSKYVLGYVIFMGIAIEHAWIKSEDKHVELTLRTFENVSEYVELFVIEYNELSEIVFSTSYPPDILDYYRHKKRKD